MFRGIIRGGFREGFRGTTGERDRREGAPAARASRRGGLLVAVLLAAAVGTAPAAASAEGAGELAKDAGLGVGTALASLVYAPVKLVYATGGLLVGGLAWAFSGGDSEVAKVVFTPSLRGDYVITSAHLAGEDRLEFFGRETPGRAVASGPPEAPASAPGTASESAWASESDDQDDWSATW